MDAQRVPGGLEFKLLTVVTSSFLKFLIIFFSFPVSFFLLSHPCFLGLPSKETTCSLVLVLDCALWGNTN